MVRKYRKGVQFTNLNQLASWIGRGGWIYWRYKVMHGSFILSMPMRTILLALHNGILFYAHRNEEKENAVLR